MSADLLAAFGDSSETAISAVNEGEPGSYTIPKQELKVEDSSWQPWPVSNTTIQRSSTKIEDKNLWRSSDEKNDVLFDADDMTLTGASGHEDDDFGDFEQAQTPKSTFLTTPTDVRCRVLDENLLDLGDDDDGTAYATTGLRSLSRTAQERSPASGVRMLETAVARSTISEDGVVEDCNTHPSLSMDNDWDLFEGFETVSEKPNDQNSAQSALPSMAKIGQGDKSIVSKIASRKLPEQPPRQPISAGDDFDAWDDFQDGVPEAMSSSIIKKVSIPAAQAADTIPIRHDRPTNIPPPIVLLTLLSNVFSGLVIEARRPETSASTGIKVLQAYRVSARVIAGRTYRWKRDAILSQSMRIGVAGRQGGMKLTSLDKGESRKEEQAAEEVVASWSTSSQVLSAALTKARLSRPSTPLSTNLSVRTAVGVDVLNANHVCPICGLRRNERINGMDVDILDSFDEFWIEYWGHKDCHDVWYTHNKLLHQR